ncbi:MAG: hypothetical protein R3F60_30655 [bacterium]
MSGACDAPADGCAGVVCGAGQSCDAGRCVDTLGAQCRPCETEVDCPDGFTCLLYDGRRGACGVNCDANRACPDGLVCYQVVRDNQPRFACGNRSGCNQQPCEALACGGQICDYTIGQCVDCRVDADCRPGQACQQNQCVDVNGDRQVTPWGNAGPTCENDRACTADERCRSVGAAGLGALCLLDCADQACPAGYTCCRRWVEPRASAGCIPQGQGSPLCLQAD